MPRPLIAGNWKMNGSKTALEEIGAIATAAAAAPGVDVALCPPFTLIEHAAALAAGTAVAIGGQDCHAARQGAYTGWVSAPMLAEAGATMVIVGHSERRQYAHERDADVAAKADAAIAAGLVAIVCVGETEAERDAGEAEAVVARQLKGSLPASTGGAASEWLVVAYEPVWAIGTGRTASAADVAAIHAAIRRDLAAMLGEAEGARVRILYGGSVNAGNAAELLAVANVDGALVGGASLTAGAFVPIVDAAARTT